MKYSILLLLFFLFSENVVLGQIGWTRRGPEPGNYNYFDLHMSDGMKGVARTNTNLLAVTTNGGLVWRNIPFVANSNVRANHMTFSSPLIGYIATEQGPIYKTLDGGLTWANTFAGNNFETLYFESDLVGYAIQNLGVGTTPVNYFRTTNGGQSWQPTGSLSSGTGIYKNLVSRVPGELWAALNPFGSAHDPNRKRPYRSWDGGQTWSPVPITTPKKVNFVRWINSQVGWLGLDSGFVGRTLDGGASWEYFSYLGGGFASSFHAYDLIFPVNGSQGILLLSDGSIYKTLNGGMTWINLGSLPVANLQSESQARIFFLDNERGWALAQNLFAKTTDGGDNWRPQTGGTGGDLLIGCLQNSNQAWLVGLVGRVLKTENRGGSWVQNQSVDHNYSGVSDIVFLNPNKGIMASQNGFFKSNDGGSNWEVISTQPMANFMEKLFFLNQSIGWAVTSLNQIYKTIDGGDNWTRIYNDNSFGANVNNRIQFINDQVGFWLYTIDPNQSLGTIGPNGLKKTTDGGNTWSILASNFAGGMSMHFFDENRGIIGLQDRPIYTTNGGQTWQSSNSLVSIRDFKFINSQLGYGVGKGHRIYKTTDGGLSWTWEPLASSFNNNSFLHTLVMDGDRPILAAGDSGVIFTANDWTLGSPDPTYVAFGRLVKNLNSDCIQDPSEMGIGQKLIKATPGPYFTSTDSMGRFYFRLSPGDYTLEQIHRSPVNSILESQICPPNQDPISVSINGIQDTIGGANFINEIKQCPILKISQSQLALRPCRNSYLSVSVSNVGSVASDTEYVHIKFPRFLHFISASDIFDFNATDSSYRFRINPLGPGKSVTISIWDSVSCLPTVVSGQTLCIQATIPNVPVCLLQSPGWDGANLEVSSQCLSSGQTRFRINNKGNSMSQAAQYRVFIDSALLHQATFQLAANNSMSVTLPANAPAGFARMVVPQSANHPLSTFASAEANCATGQSTNGMFPPPDESPLVDVECVMVTNSFDPNDKLVYPKGWGSNGKVEPETEFSYKIRFQNTGTDTAFKVVLVDTLDADLDIASLQIGVASHAYSFNVSGKGRPVLTWNFNNILLPDSNTNEEKSHGFVNFSIRPKTGLALGTRLENFADIYFDFNDPIRTNTTVNTLWRPTLVDNVIDTVFVTATKATVSVAQISIYPNPTKGRLEVNVPEAGILQLFNTKGEAVLTTQLEMGQHVLNFNQLPKGLYLIQFRNPDGRVSKKVILE